MTDVTTPGVTATRHGPTAALLVACGATFVGFLDLSVVNIAFPAILRDFTDAAPATLTWVVSGYAIAFAALLTPAGRVADAMGRRRVLLVALVCFAVASLLCAVAGDLAWLIACRLAQGAAAALMIPAALGVLLADARPEQVARSIGAWSAAGGFAAVIGPALGGALVDAWGWRAVFVINVPIAVALAAAARRLTVPAGSTTATMPDPVGIVASALGIGAVVGAITEGQSWGWNAPATVLALLAGLVLVAAALIRSRRHHSPALAVELWRSRPYALTNAASFVFGVAMFAWLLSGPMFLNAIWHYSVLGSAGALTVGAVASMVTATIAGRLPGASAQRTLGVLGALMFAGSLCWMSTNALGWNPALWSAWMPAGVLGGGGVGFVVTVLGTAAAGSLPPTAFATGTGMNMTARQVGGALGVAMLAAVLAAHTHDAVAGFHALFRICAVVAAGSACLIATIHPRREEIR